MCIFMLSAMVSCSTDKTGSESVQTSGGNENGKIKLITLDPGHFHAALVQKTMYENVDSVVHVFAPEGADVQDYLNKIEAYNTLPENPTQEDLYTELWK